MRRWYAGLALGAMLLFAVSMLLVGCGETTQQAIIGTWQMSRQNVTMEFQEDGTIIVTDRESSQVVTGTYRLNEAMQLELDMQGQMFGSRQVVFEVDLRANQMTLTGALREGGRPTVMLFTRTT